LKTLVIVKEIIDTNKAVGLDKFNQIDSKDADFVANIYDEYAIEEALRLKEKHGGEVVLYSLGSIGTLKTMGYVGAMGVDRIVLIDSKAKNSKDVSESLSKFITEHDGDFDLILCGHVGINNNNGQVPGRMSRILDLPFINVVSKLQIEDRQVLCEKEGEVYQEVVESSLPAVITVQRGINEPRKPTASRIMQMDESMFEVIKDSREYSGGPMITYEHPKERKDPFMIQENSSLEAVDLLIEKLIDYKVL
jgi:electron transfer flavoprotein beta subunit